MQGWEPGNFGDFFRTHHINQEFKERFIRQVRTRSFQISRGAAEPRRILSLYPEPVRVLIIFSILCSRMRLFTLRCANAVFTTLHLKLCELCELCVSFCPAFRQVRCAIGELSHAKFAKSAKF